MRHVLPVDIGTARLARAALAAGIPQAEAGAARWLDLDGAAFAELGLSGSVRLALRAPLHLLLQVAEGEAAGQIALAGAEARLAPGATLHVVPAGAMLEGRVEGRLRLRVLLLGAGRLRRAAGEPGGPLVAPASALDVADRCLVELMRALEAALRDGGDAALAGAEEAVAAIAARIVECHAAGAGLPAAGEDLPPWRLRRLDAFVDAHLDARIGAQAMAMAAGLPPRAFARALRRMGVTPAAFLRERRCRRARALLAEGRLSVAEVALACGFANQSQLTAVFRQVTGTTPGAWRRAQLAA